MMYDVAVWAAQNIHIPFSISMVLYVWIAVGYMVLGQGWMALAWGCYSVANCAFMQQVFVDKRTLP